MWSPPEGRTRDVFLERICRGKAYGVSIRRGRLQHGMRVHTEAEVGLTRPVFQIVARLKTWPTNIGNFILRDSSRFELFACGDIEISRGFFVWNKMRVITRTPGDQLASQSRVIVDFEH